MTTWLDIPNYEGLYQASDEGEVVSLKSKCLMRAFTSPSGYCYINLSKNKEKRQFLVHRLVMLTFVGECLSGMEVNHIDCDKGNNSVLNLEYTTSKENVRHATDNNLRKPLTGEDNPSSKLTWEKVRSIRTKYGNSNISQRGLAKEFGVSQKTVVRIIHNEIWVEKRGD